MHQYSGFSNDHKLRRNLQPIQIIGIHRRVFGTRRLEIEFIVFPLEGQPEKFLYDTIKMLAHARKCSARCAWQASSGGQCKAILHDPLVAAKGYRVVPLSLIAGSTGIDVIRAVWKAVDKEFAGHIRLGAPLQCLKNCRRVRTWCSR